MAYQTEGLRAAASQGRLDLIKQMLATDHINLLDWSGCALPAAVENGHLDVVEYLLQRGVNTGVSIIVASSIGSVKMVEVLLEHGASVGDKNYDGKTPLHCACEEGHLDVVTLLLKKGAFVDVKDISERTPLHLACKNGQLKVVAMLLRKKAKVNVKDRAGNSSLHHACKSGTAGIVQKLLRRKANVHALNGTNMIPLDCACELGNTEVVKVLMANGNYTREELDVALLVTAQNGFHLIAEILLACGARVRNETNPLFNACMNGQIEVVKVLIAHGANICEKEPDGKTPLHIASGTQHADIVELLLRHGGNPSIQDACGRTPLHYAKSTDVIRILMEHGADVNATDLRRNPAIVYVDNVDLGSTLLAHGAGAGLKCRKRVCARESTGMMCHYTFHRNNVICNCRITGQSCYSESSHRSLSLIDCFEMHFIKLKTAKIAVNDSEKAIDPPVDRKDWSESKRRAFTDFCKAELDKMKTRIIPNTAVTYLDLLTRNIFDLQSEAIMGNYNLTECLDNFPIFGDMIYNKYLKFRRAFLKEQSITFFGLTEPWLPIECAKHIIRYLASWDLDVLVKVCHT